MELFPQGTLRRFLFGMSPDVPDGPDVKSPRVLPEILHNRDGKLSLKK